MSLCCHSVVAGVDSKVRNRVDRVAEYSTYSPKGGTTKAVVSSDFDKTPTTKDVVSSKSHY